MKRPGLHDWDSWSAWKRYAEALEVELITLRDREPSCPCYAGNEYGCEQHGPLAAAGPQSDRRDDAD